MFEEQRGLCAICREAKAAHVDHDHATGGVRGLLCFNCNGAPGQFRDRTDVMPQALVYLRRDAFPEGVPPPLRPVLSLIIDNDGEERPPDDDDLDESPVDDDVNPGSALGGTDEPPHDGAAATD